MFLKSTENKLEQHFTIKVYESRYIAYLATSGSERETTK